ncbi:MAG: hypothetical protein JOZ25_03985 [Actinobacteria bacterium]|nr:hypothetical protein [Actinomycetota bacterium]
MGLLDRLRGEREPATPAVEGTLRPDARAMRTALSMLHAERSAARPRQGEPDLRGLVRDVLDGEVEAPTDDVRFLISSDTEPDEFHDSEIAPNWEGLGESARAAKLDGFVELAQMADASPGVLPREMVATVRTKALVLAWAFDEVHGYLGRMELGDGDDTIAS